MNELNIIDEKKIENMIYEIRGQQVMLDSDLAKLYDVETKRINEAVTRNKEKFPDRYTWKLTSEEDDFLRSQIATSSVSPNRGGRRYECRVFTEQGVAMLATILKSRIATYVSIQIMDAFVAMRKYISSELIEQKYVNNMVFKNEERINILEKAFSKFDRKMQTNEIFFNGQIYDAYSKILSILETAKKKIILIDRFADRIVLDMISHIKVSVILVIKEKSLISKLDIEKYNEQYSNLTIIYDDTFHDRYIIIDDKIIYHCGASLNYAGSRTFSINVLEDKNVIEFLLAKIKEIYTK